MGALWTLIPDEALPLVFVLGALLLMIGFRRTGMSLMVTALATPLVSPFVEYLMALLPAWLSLVILFLVGLSILRGFAALLLGSRAADHMVGILAADVVRVVLFALILLPARIARGAFALATRARGARFVQRRSDAVGRRTA